MAAAVGGVAGQCLERAAARAGEAKHRSDKTTATCSSLRRGSERPTSAGPAYKNLAGPHLSLLPSQMSLGGH